MSPPRISCPRVKRSVYRWNRATVQKFHEDWQLFEGEQPRSVGSFFYQNALQGTGNVLCTFAHSALLFGSNSEEATERAVYAVALAFLSLIRRRNPKMALLPCAPLAFLSGLKLPFPSNACHAGYGGIQDSLGFWITRFGFRIPGNRFQSLSVDLGFWILIVSGILYSLSWIPDSKSKSFPDSEFHKQNLSTFRNTDSLTGANCPINHYFLL